MIKTSNPTFVGFFICRMMIKFGCELTEYIMAFGFPAYHTESYKSDKDNIDLFEKIKEGIISLGWKINSQTSNKIIGSTSISLMSWGETLEIVKTDENLCTITSKCSLPIQCVDYGKNKSNVMKLISIL